ERAVFSATWILLTQSDSFFGDFPVAKLSKAKRAEQVVWTDGYNNLWPLLNVGFGW
ncbi:MAG: hypothetical protein ACI9HK_005686, partial [Pirellulaceae bacterium]